MPGRLDAAGQGRWVWALDDEDLFDLRPMMFELGLFADSFAAFLSRPTDCSWQRKTVAK